MTLVEALKDLPSEHVSLIGSSGHRTAGELIAMAETQGPRLQGARVALKAADPVTGIEALVAADGRADSITLLSQNLNEQHLPLLIERSGSDLLLDTSGELGVGSSSIQSFSSLQQIGPANPAVDTGRQTTAWQLTTSGTTGTPKIVAHTLKSLSRTTRRRPPGYGVARWGLIYDYTRFAGIQVVLQALLGGSTLIAPPPELALRERLAMLADHGCTHLSATPTLWRTIVMTPGGPDLPLEQITLGGEIADQRILRTLKSIYPDARITHIYASTEAGVGFSVNDGEPGFPASYLETPPAGLDLRLIDSRLQIKNTGLRPAYVGTGDRFGADDGWIDTGDNVEQVGDRVYFRGRASGVINVGGNKVHPEEVERLLLSHPEVQAARVFGKKSSIMGTLVAAEIVPIHANPDPVSFRAEIRQYLQNIAEDFKVPAVLTLVDHIDATLAGKIDRGAAL